MRFRVWGGTVFEPGGESGAQLCHPSSMQALDPGDSVMGFDDMFGYGQAQGRFQIFRHAVKRFRQLIGFVVRADRDPLFQPSLGNREHALGDLRNFLREPIPEPEHGSIRFKAVPYVFYGQEASGLRTQLSPESRHMLVNGPGVYFRGFFVSPDRLPQLVAGEDFSSGVHQDFQEIEYL